MRCGSEPFWADDRTEACEHDALQVRFRRVTALACDLGVGSWVRAVSRHLRQPHAAFSDRVCAHLRTDRRPANDPLLDAFYPATDVFRHDVVHLPHCDAAFFEAGRRLGDDRSGVVSWLSLLFV